MDDEEIQGLKTLFQSSDKNDWQLALVLMEGLNLTPERVSELLTMDDFIYDDKLNLRQRGHSVRTRGWYRIREYCRSGPIVIGTIVGADDLMSSRQRSRENIEELINKNNG